MNKNTVIGIVAFGGLILIGLAMSGNSSEQNNSPEQVEVSEETSTIPSQVAASIPTYPNSVASNVRESSNESADFVSVSLAAQASISEVHEWYRNALSSNGWSITSDKNVAGYQIIQGENDNLYTSFQVANGNNPDEVIISQQIQFRK